VRALKAELLVGIKALRMYWLYTFISMMLIPMVFLLIVALATGASGEGLAYQLTGFLGVSLMGSLLIMLAERARNLMEPGIIEFYSVLPVRMWRPLMAQVFVNAIVVLPQTVLALVLAAQFSPFTNTWLLLVGLVVAVVVLSLLGITLGFALGKNPVIASGVISLMSWVLMMLSPAFYSVPASAQILRAVILANPISHVLGVIRAPMGLQAPASLAVSYIYLGALAICAFIYVALRTQKLYMLERQF